jgi:hypothetical protein
LKTQIGNESLKEVSQREEAKKVVKKSFEEKFQVFTALLQGFSVLLTWCSLGRISGSSRLFGSRRACCCGTAFIREFI